jgi:hypothetical protein
MRLSPRHSIVYSDLSGRLNDVDIILQLGLKSLILLAAVSLCISGESWPVCQIGVQH